MARRQPLPLPPAGDHLRGGQLRRRAHGLGGSRAWGPPQLSIYVPAAPRGAPAACCRLPPPCRRSLLAHAHPRFLPVLLRRNSNLVLTAEQRTSAGREPDGSAETLWGRMKGAMGDRVARERPEGLAGKKPKKREAGEGEAYDLPKRRKVGGPGVGWQQ